MKRIAAIVTLIFCMSGGILTAADTLFVVSSAQHGRDGRSWETAFPTLQSAVAAALTGDEIWVARGTYRVGAEVINIPSGILLFGGFVGTEVRREERDWLANPVNISPLPDPSPMITLTHVSADTRLDGFVVFGATSRAVLVDGGAPLIRNCVFKENHAQEAGAVLVVNADSAVFSFCTFSRNTTVTRGGALMTLADRGRTCDVLIEQCIFDGNTTEGRGGAVAVVGAKARTNIVNCVFLENIAEYSAGAVYSLDAATYLSHCTFVRNDGLSVYVSARTIEAEQSGRLTMRNCIVWNSDSIERRHILIRNAENSRVDVLFRANVVEYDTTFSTWRSDPQFVNIKSPYGADGRMGTPDDGLRLSSASPLVGAALNDVDEVNRANDITARPRSVFVGSDVGAYEDQRSSHGYDSSIRALLRSGDVVLAFVHAQTDRAGAGSGPQGLCPGQRNLSVKGRSQARDLGRYLATVCPPVSISVSGTTCRNWETSMLMVGYSLKEEAWDGGSSSDDAERRYADLHNAVDRGPRVIVTDATVLASLVGLDASELHEGDAVILAGEGAETVVRSHFTSETWERIALGDLPTSVGRQINDQRTNVFSDQLAVYPNPAGTVLNIKTNSKVTVRMFTVVGEMVGEYLVDGATLVDVGDLPRGPYLLVDDHGVTRIVTVSSAP